MGICIVDILKAEMACETFITGQKTYVKMGWTIYHIAPITVMKDDRLIIDATTK
jgi:hypothetical protein